nr:hypothetical protein GCM10025732_40750 [Glycomyces mayteni]
MRIEVHDAEAGAIRVEASGALDPVAPVTTARLGISYQAETGYTDPDGSDLDFGTDLAGAPRGEAVPGPFAAPSPAPGSSPRRARPAGLPDLAPGIGPPRPFTAAERP